MAADPDEKQVKLDALGEALGGLRLTSSDALRRMQDSLERHGQLAALAVYANPAGALEVVDGFKRLRAARVLHLEELLVRVVAQSTVHAKVALRVLNEGHGLSDLEEAWLCRSLYREDHLTQPEIGRLLGRHKSWVCRRLVLAEALDEGVQADVRLGLIAAKTAGQLSWLPRGNQGAAAQVVVRRGLTSGQTDRLVGRALALPDEASRARLLSEELSRRVNASDLATSGSPRPSPPGARTEAEWIVTDAAATTRLCARLQGRLWGRPLAGLGAPGAALVDEALRSLLSVLLALERQIASLTEGPASTASAKEQCDGDDLDDSRGTGAPDGAAEPAGPGAASDSARSGG